MNPPLNETLFLQTCGASSGVQDGCGSSSSDGQSECEGEGCHGVVTMANKVWKKAQEQEQEIINAMGEVEKLSKMVSGTVLLHQWLSTDVLPVVFLTTGRWSA